VWRYERQAGLVDGGAESVRWSVVPTPVEMSLDPHAGRTMNVQTDGWVVVVVQHAPPHLDNEARYLAGIHASFPSSQHASLCCCQVVSLFSTKLNFPNSKHFLILLLRCCDC